MRKFQAVTSGVVPLGKANVDTDQLVPKQFLKLVTKSGFGKYLFYNWRFAGDRPDPSFVLNDKRHEGSRILMAGENFGCGSSREHAVWALLDYGFDVVLAPSFADIFYTNCFKNGLLPVSLEPAELARIEEAGGQVTVDLESQTVSAGDISARFEIDPFKKKVLLEGLDDIALTLAHEEAITRHEKASRIPSVT